MGALVAATDVSDEAWLRRCIALAQRAFGRTWPNPMVGSVIVGADGQLLAEGYHRGPGLLHAEADALAKLGGKAPGATLYVNLEPCNHYGRTPPCARAIVASGIARVVYGMSDPIPGHAGGAAFIAMHGIVVEGGVLQRECEVLNRDFAMWARREHARVAAAEMGEQYVG